MDNLVLTIPVPDGTNTAALCGELTKQIPELVDKTVRYISRRILHQAACESKAGLKRFVEELGIEDPVGRASYYVGYGDCEMRREIGGFDVGLPLERDSQRPVIMRGSFYWLVRHYSKGHYGSDCANGWCERVVKRYLRKIKYTCFNAADHREFLHEIYCKLQGKKGLYLSPATFYMPHVSAASHPWSEPPFDVNHASGVGRARVRNWAHCRWKICSGCLRRGLMRLPHDGIRAEVPCARQQSLFCRLFFGAVEGIDAVGQLWTVCVR